MHGVPTGSFCSTPSVYQVPARLEAPLHLGGRGVRVGEAANPGPATVVFAKATSLKGAWAKLLTAEAVLLEVQEARCTAAELTTMARQQNRQVVYGAEIDGRVLVASLPGKECSRRLASAKRSGPPLQAANGWPALDGAEWLRAGGHQAGEGPSGDGPCRVA